MLTSVPELDQALLAAYGCDSAGGYLVVDDLSHPGWQRSRFFVLGAAAGIRNVMHAANEINARMASKDLEK